MKILVLSGSPKGENSITLQTVRWLEKRRPGHTWEVLHVGAQYRRLESDPDTVRKLAEAELILFVYPVYTFLVPYQLHHFIEHIKASGADLRGKFASQITTSKHFYDVTAHRFIQDNCQDLGMKYVRGLSADMEDLLTEKGRREAEDFFDYLLWCAAEDRFEPIPVPAPPPAHRAVTVPESGGEKPGNVVIVADLSPEDAQLAAMIGRFRAVFPRQTTVVNLREFPFRGGCLSCFRCAAEGKCVYKDGFDEFLRTRIQTGEAIVPAFSIRDHSMGSRFKLYDDRQFCNGHRSVTMGMPFGYLISGDYSREPNLQMLVRARAEVGGNFLAGTATDESDPDGEIDTLAARLNYAVEHHYVQPADFYGVGGMKIFRDLIWQMQGLMRADHRFYKSHGQYDFPQKKRGRMLAMYLVGALASNEKLSAKLGGRMTEGMLMPYRKALEKAERKK